MLSLVHWSLALALGGSALGTETPSMESVVVLRAPGPEQVLVRGGAFRMGSEPSGVVAARALCALEPGKDACARLETSTGLFADEISGHLVTLSDFWLDRTEVTVRAYRRCVEAGPCRIPGYAAAGAWLANDDLPVSLVSWHDAVAYCEWQGGRLPTEAEWERAARGWADRLYPWGQIYNPMLANHGRLAWDRLDQGDGFSELAPVGAFPQGNTPEGITDLAGNVEEWVNDWYAAGYPPGHAVDPPGPARGEARVVRGGSYRSARPWLRTMARSHALASTRRTWRGFRCARSRLPLARASDSK